MPIELVTGLPGAGKSLGAVDRMLQWRDHDSTRPVFVLGVDGLKDGIAQEITPEDLQRWYEYPSGSIFVVDECQKYFPMRRAGDPPAWVRRLSEHRHLGHDFLLMTQAPGYLDAYVRGLVDRHTHLVRKFGTGIVDRYEWPHVSMSPLSASERKRAVKKVWRYPRRCFDLYKSAELHTVKRRIPKKFFVLVGALVFIPVAILVVKKIMSHTHAPAHVAAVAGAGPASVASRDMGSQVKWATPAEYVKAFTPRVAAYPWSAPVYDGRTIKAQPDLYCIEAQQPAKDGRPPWWKCTCYTEQLTIYHVGSAEICRTYAEQGVYNPYRPPLAARRRRELSRKLPVPSPASSAAVTQAAPASDPVAQWPGESSAIHTPYVTPGALIAGHP